MTWTFTNEDKSIAVSTSLQEIDGQAGKFSYSVVIPMEADLPGFPVSDNALIRSPSPVTYTRPASVTGTEIDEMVNVDISTNDRGTFVNVPIGMVDTDNDGLQRCLGRADC